MYSHVFPFPATPNLSKVYTIIIAGKFGGELYLAIWPPNAEIKYWRNLNLAICDCEAEFHCVILACG